MKKFDKDYTQKIYKLRSILIKDLDKDNNGIVDLLEIDYLKELIKKNQKNILEIDKKHIHQFIQLSKYLEIKKNNIQTIFNNIRKYDIKTLKIIPGTDVKQKYQEIRNRGDIGNGESIKTLRDKLNSQEKSDLEIMIELIRESIHNYNLLTIHSLNMVTSIIEEDFIQFYELYELFKNECFILQIGKWR